MLSRSATRSAAKWLTLFTLGAGLILPVAVFAQTSPTAPPAAPATPAAPTTPAATPPATAPATAPVAPPATPPTAFRSIQPNPEVPIPGVRFTPATQQGNVISVPFLAQYITGIYRVSVGLGAILAAIMIVYGGFRYLLAATLPGVKEGKEVIQDAFIGLIVLLTSYLILNTINPALTQMSPIRVPMVAPEEPLVTDANGTGNPAFSPIGDSHSDTMIGCGGARSGRTQTIEGNTFTVLPLRKAYIQMGRPWGVISYGPNLNTNESLHPCKRSGGGTSEDVTNGCWQTLSNGGCGVTAFATIMAYYNVRTSNPGDAQLAQNVMYWNGDQLVPVAQIPNHGAQIQALLTARVGEHLYDPLDAARASVAAGSGGSNGQAVTRNSDFMNVPGFSSATTRDPAVAAQYIRNGTPLILYCGKCRLKQHNISDPDHEGGNHIMVINGVSQDNRWFMVHDTGGGGTAGGKFISADEIQNGMNAHSPGHHSVDLRAIFPTSANVQACNTASDSADNSAGAATPPPASVSGDVTAASFADKPSTGATDEGWPTDSPGQLLIPTRLVSAFHSGTHPQVHLYIFLHSLNSHQSTFADQQANSGSSYSQIKRALGEVAGSKNIIVAMPINLDPSTSHYMSGFDLAEFYQRAVAALHDPGTLGLNDADIADVLVGGHSAATCNGPGTPVLKQALTTNLGHQLLGIAAYDGCMSDADVFSPTNFDISSVSGARLLLMNPDLDASNGAMGARRYENIRSGWNLHRTICPPTVENVCPDGNPGPASDRSCNACYGNTDNGIQYMSIETSYGHKPSIYPMTKNVFQAFYTNNP